MNILNGSEEAEISKLCLSTHLKLEEVIPELLFQSDESGKNFFSNAYEWIKCKFYLTAFSAAGTAAAVIIALSNGSADRHITSAALVPPTENKAVSYSVKESVSVPKTGEAVPMEPKKSESETIKTSSGEITEKEAKALSGTTVVKGVPAPPAEKRSDNKTGVYLTANSLAREKFFNETLDDLLKSGGNALVFDVKGGAVLFHSAAPMAKESDLIRPIFDLKEILEISKERGIYTIGRFVAIKDGGLTMKKPETRVKNPKTGKDLSRDWIDPADDTAIEYNMQIICELASMGIDEINMDYIRFSTAEWGALKVFSGKEKADRVEKFVKAARETIDRCGKQTKLGISTYAILGWNYPDNLETLGQDVVRFAPLVDVISPMAYPSTFAANAYYRPGKDPGSRDYFLVYRTLTGYKELLGEEQSKKIRPWIQGYGVTTRDLSDEIKAVYDAGFCGFTVWNANNGYSPAYTSMKNDRIRPERCSGT